MVDRAKDAALAHPRTVGSNQVGMRQYNERIVLQAIRLHGPLPKADVARLTRLSIADRLGDHQRVCWKTDW